MWRLRQLNAPAATRRFVLQWHITNRCNLRCAHCYQETYQDHELAFEQQRGIIRQFENLLESRGVRGHITVTGGEPFVRKDFFDLLEAFAEKRERFSFSILTNGSLIDRSIARKIRRLSPSYVQVSLEGSRETHDRIRAPGDFDRTVAAIRTLKQERVPALISFTAHSANFREFPVVARLGRKLGVKRVWADRFIPLGSGSSMRDMVLTPDETREFFQLLAIEKRAAARAWFCSTEIATHRALQFLVAGGRPYRCSAGDSLLALMPNGEVLPCRRMPVPVGNLMETPLGEVYLRSPLLNALRDRANSAGGCQGCFHEADCRGGLRCLSFATASDPFRADPGCWKAHRNQTSTSLYKLPDSVASSPRL